MAFWSALRCWGERAVAAGMLSLDQIRNADPAACTLVSGGEAPGVDYEPEKLGAVTPAECPGQTEEI
jgi:hypothetical protein